MTYLLLITWVTGVTATTTAIEFNSKDACLRGKHVIEQIEAGVTKARYMECVRK